MFYFDLKYSEDVSRWYESYLLLLKFYNLHLDPVFGVTCKFWWSHQIVSMFNFSRGDRCHAACCYAECFREIDVGFCYLYFEGWRVFLCFSSLHLFRLFLFAFSFMYIFIMIIILEFHLSGFWGFGVLGRMTLGVWWWRKM